MRFILFQPPRVPRYIYTALTFSLQSAGKVRSHNISVFPHGVILIKADRYLS